MVINEKSKYTGNMDENTYKTTKTVGKVASAIGGPVTVLGGTQERKAGGLALLGSIGAEAATGQGYPYKMKFRCVR